ncbi:MAG: DUF3631 domain-containing protein, partial [Xanthobacteraceae bacterium]
IKLWRPSFVIDEFDSVLANDAHAELRSVINSGHTKGTGILRCEGDDRTPAYFDTFTPKVIGMKGRALPDTTMSRCVPVSMHRKARGQQVEKFKFADDIGLANLRSQCKRWADDNAEKLSLAMPKMPEVFQNRLADNWQLLFAIADMADLGDEARRAATSAEKILDQTSRGVRLLQCIKEIHEASRHRFYTSSWLLETLKADHPEWKEIETFRGVVELTATKLAAILKEYDIKPSRPTLDGTKQGQGYSPVDFEQAWAMYL